ncbi:MAG: ParB/RepB/Spo0J family partition protein [Myxococcota bacterium]
MATMICGYPIHPACDMLPMMPDAGLEEMAEDIRRHGQQQPVVIYQGQILDGRNRLRACELAGVQPEVREWSGEDPIRWVLSLNFHRRHLTEDQKSVVGARAERLIAGLEREGGEGAAGEGSRAGDAGSAGGPAVDPMAQFSDRAMERKARQTAATLVNVSPARIARGRKLLDEGVPELVKAVESGSLSMSQAARVSKLSPRAQEALVAQGADAVIDESRRMAEAGRAKVPSLARALADLDAQCGAWTLSRSVGGEYSFAGEGADGAVVGAGRDARAALTEAWLAACGDDSQEG